MTAALPAEATGKPVEVWFSDEARVGSPRLKLPDNIVLLALPRYAPELKPVENVWEFLRSNWLSHCVWQSYEAIVDACCNAWNKLMNMPEQIASITQRSWAQQTVSG